MHDDDVTMMTRFLIEKIMNAFSKALKFRYESARLETRFEKHKGHGFSNETRYNLLYKICRLIQRRDKEVFFFSAKKKTHRFFIQERAGKGEITSKTLVKSQSLKGQ